MNDSIKDWCSEKLSQLLGNCFLPDSDLVSYVLEIESPRDLEEFLKDLFGDEKKGVCHGFVKDLQKKRFEDISFKDEELNNKPAKKMPENAVSIAYQPNSVDAQTLDIREPSKEDSVSVPPGFINLPEKQLQGSISPFKKKQLKYVPLFNSDGKSNNIIIPGRHACECLAQKHQLINNCSDCGRIVCEQEGSGPCFFCGNLVCSPEEQEILTRKSKKSSKLMQKLMTSTPSESQPNEVTEESKKETRAKAHKEKLLEYDRTSAKRTKVIDDESDYFSSSSKWMSAENRKKLKEREEELLNKKYSSRKNKKYNIDFAGRKITESIEDSTVYNPNDHVIKSIEQSNAIQPGSDTMVVSVDPRIKVPRPQFVQDENQSSSKTKDNTMLRSTVLRVQDKEFLEMQDDGFCLSMHQPWASLLVCGIKTVEGRSWYSSHRGRLWIAAAAKVPTSDEIDIVENQYRRLGINDFPNDYPTGVLLGSVDIVDCLKNEEYKTKAGGYCSEESDSSYVFICQNPRELLIKLPMKGQHKIWKLDSCIHNTIRRGVLASG